MNPREQRTRHTAVTRLAGDMETVLEGFADASNKAMNVLAHDGFTYTDEQCETLRVCCQERWDATCEAQKRIIDRAAAFQSRGFLDRLRWLILGQ